MEEVHEIHVLSPEEPCISDSRLQPILARAGLNISQINKTSPIPLQDHVYTEMNFDIEQAAGFPTIQRYTGLIFVCMALGLLAGILGLDSRKRLSKGALVALETVQPRFLSKYGVNGCCQ